MTNVTRALNAMQRQKGWLQSWQTSISIFGPMLLASLAVLVVVIINGPDDSTILKIIAIALGGGLCLGFFTYCLFSVAIRILNRRMKFYSRIEEDADRERALIDEAKHLEDQYFPIVEQIREANVELQSFPDINYEERVKKQFESIAAIPEVGSERMITVNNENMVVTTRELSAVDPRDNRRHGFGRFNIVIYHNGSKGGVVCIGADRPKVIDTLPYFAPYIDGSGRIIPVQIKQAIPSFIANRDYAGLVQMVINVICNIDENDAYGQRIIHWPVLQN